ncbi:hypothetical protein [Solilutibacter silvestris]|uniref:hypothetical protein n=1 Tax=Solilutibacter silvestris TaxID=1645665 RepID=UPI003D353732
MSRLWVRHRDFLLTGLLCIALSIFCLRLWFSAYTSGDDGYTAFAALNPNGLWASAKEMAFFQGRFYQLLVYPVAMLPFKAESMDVFNICRIANFLFYMAGFAYLCWVAFGKSIMWLSLFLFIGLYDTVGGSYNPFHGLPLWFGVGCGLLCFSIGSFTTAIRAGRYPVMATLLFALSLLTYEIVLLYVPLYGLIAMWVQGKGREHSARTRIFWALKSTSGIALVSIAYLIAYAVFRKIHPASYVGAEGLSLGSPLATLKPIYEFSVLSLYWTTKYSGAHGLTAQSLLLAITVLVGIFASLRQFGRAGHDGAIAESPGMVLLIAGYVFVPNILFGLTQRYRIWSGDGVQFYLGSLSSAMAMCILLAVIIAMLRPKFSARTWQLVGGGIALGIAVLGYANSRNSQNFFAQSEEMSSRWGLADLVSARLKNELLDANAPVPAPYVICGDGFTQTTQLPVYFKNPDMLADADLYWSRYFSRQMKRDVKYTSKGVAPGHCDASIALDYSHHMATYSRIGAAATQIRLPENHHLEW